MLEWILVLAAMLLVFVAQEMRHQAKGSLALPSEPKTTGELSGEGSQSATPPDAVSATPLESLGDHLDWILASISSGVLAIDLTGRITAANPEAERAVRAQPGSLVGQVLWESPQLAALVRVLNHARASFPPDFRSSRQYEAEVGDPAQVQVLGLTVNGVFDPQGRMRGWVVSCKNLSDVRAAQEDAERQRRLTALGSMASGVAHNFNNILMTILGRVQLLLRFPHSPDKTLDSLRLIEKSALDGSAAVKRIQDFAKNKPMDEEFGPVDADEIVTDVVAFTRARWSEEARERGVSYDVHTEVGARLRARGSSSELREVLINLMLNAIDAMPTGGRLVMVTASTDDRVIVRCQDTGQGMTEEVRSRVFDPFFTTKGIRGTGLGLFESLNIVQRHKGTLRCESTPGQGTTFILDLPAWPEVPAA